MKMSKQGRPKIGDRVEFAYRGRELTRVGKIVAVDGSGVYFKVETDHTKYRVRREWDGDKLVLHVPLSKIKRIIPMEEIE